MWKYYGVRCLLGASTWICAEAANIKSTLNSVALVLDVMKFV